MPNLSLVTSLARLQEEQKYTEEVVIESAGIALARGSLAEISGQASSGKTSLSLSLLAKLTAAGEICAVVDSSNSFDPRSAVLAGVELDNLLWVRCSGDLEKAFMSADYLVQAKGFGAIWLNLNGLPQRQLRLVPKTYWYRYRNRIKETPTLFLVTAGESVSGSASQRSFLLSRERAAWSGSGRFKLLRELHIKMHSRKGSYSQAFGDKDRDGLQRCLNLYACIISANAKADKEELTAIARQFAYSIEMLDDGVLFDVRGLERLIGDSDQIAQNILENLKANNISGNVAVADTVDTAMLLARQNRGLNHTVASPAEFQKLPLRDLDIEKDSLGIFTDLGINNIEDLRQIPKDDLINRYGPDFYKVLDIIEQNHSSFLTPNIKESNVAWKYELDFAVDDFEQLIFILNHGLDDLLGRIAHYGLSTEQLDIEFKLSNKTARSYEIKTSFPTLDKTFWLKLINLRVSLDPPEAAISAVSVTAHFTKPRPTQKGLYAVSRPEPESLLLTVNKIKKLVGEENVGIPGLLDQRLSEAFALDADKMPQGKEADDRTVNPIIAFNYFHPPIRAEVLVREGRLVFVKTQYFSGHVTEYSGVWKANSKWWDRSWKTQEWDVEVENHGIYRLCKVDKDWFLAGEYD